LDNTNAITVKDTQLTIQDDGDVTKQARFNAGLITAGATRTYSLPDVAGDTLVTVTSTATLTNKTLTTPAIDVINEASAGAGVTADGVLNKDGGVNIAGALALSGQIVFPATQNASSNANTLDDYEEGTWTPTIAGTSTPGTQTYATQLGYYTKIGRVVVATWVVELSAFDGATNGNMTIAGLPFTALNIGSFRQSSNISRWGNIVIDVAGSRYVLNGFVSPNGTAVNLVESGNNVTTATLTQADFGATSSLQGTLSYITA